MDGTRYQPIQLLLENVVAELGQMLQRLVLGFPLRQQVYRRLQPQVVQCKMRAGWITRCSQSRNGCAGFTTRVNRLIVCIAVTQAAAR